MYGDLHDDARCYFGVRKVTRFSSQMKLSIPCHDAEHLDGVLELEKHDPVRDLSGLFFMSGAAALIYQIAWQRALFASLGMDVVSVATIVATFMLGLGIGAVAGGIIADRSRHLIVWFSGIELLVGIYGAFSIALIRLLTDATSASGATTGVLVSMLALLTPTILMGATLPLLVIQATRIWGNIGEFTGRLYFANTLGAATGAIGCGFVLFHFVTLSQSVLVAVALNLLVAAMGFRLQRRFVA